MGRCDCPRGRALAMGANWGKPPKKKTAAAPAPATWHEVDREDTYK
jgi:hypothetical protein